jgi:hypothetical protein
VSLKALFYATTKQKELFCLETERTFSTDAALSTLEAVNFKQKDVPKSFPTGMNWTESA